MEQLTVYRAQGKDIGLTFLFKYDLKGNLKTFDVAEGNMVEKQVLWLMKVPEGTNMPKFPAFEADFKDRWLNSAEMTAKFDITVSPADLSFEAFWNLYDLKVKRAKAEPAWYKLNEADRIKCFNALPKYEAFLKHTGQAKAHLVTWLNQQRWLDEYPETFTPPPKERVGKVFNSALQDLANKKTEK